MAVASKRELLYEIKIDDKGTVVIEKLGVKTKDAGKAFDALTKDIEKIQQQANFLHLLYKHK